MSEGGKYVNDLSFGENFILSGVAAVISKSAAAPIERVKLMVQNQSEMVKQGILDKPYRGVVDCTVRTFKSEGTVSFWRGNLANCIRYFPTQALNFAFKDQIKVLFDQKPQDSYPVMFAKNVASGGAAGALSLVFVYSLDYTRTRLANDAKSSARGGQRQFNGMIDVYRKTLKSDGIAGLYRGFLISCGGIIVYRGCYFGFYDSLKPLLLGDNASLMGCFGLGYGVTVTSGLISYPIDTIRRRMMMTSGQKVKYKSAIDCGVQIMKNEGFMSMMRGSGTNILRGIAGAGVLAGFDMFKDVYVKFKLVNNFS